MDCRADQSITFYFISPLLNQNALQLDSLDSKAETKAQLKGEKKKITKRNQVQKGKGYQVSGGSVFKCEMSSKVVGHMIGVPARQRSTYWTDLK